MRYIDDLLFLNNSGFTHRATDIYPSELVLKRTTESPMELSYLDLLITQLIVVNIQQLYTIKVTALILTL